MQAIVEQALPGTRSRISFHESYPPMAPTPGNLKVLEAYSAASADAGLGPVVAFPPGQRGAGDVQFVAPLVDSLDGLGAAGGGAHTPDEWLDISSIERGAIPRGRPHLPAHALNGAAVLRPRLRARRG